VADVSGAAPLASPTFSGTFTTTGTLTDIGNTSAGQQINIGAGSTVSGSIKTISIGDGGQSGSTTNITIGQNVGVPSGVGTIIIGSTTNSTTTLNGTVNATTATAGTSTTQIATTAFVTTADNLKANIASPSLTGTPLSTTAAADTNTTQIATTAYVVGQAGSATPLVNGTAAVGTSLRFARQDHVHGTDTSRAPLASPTFTGTVTIPAGASISGFAPLASPAFTGTPSLPTGTTAVTQTAGNNTTALATTAFVQQEVPAASTTAAGKVELATFDEAILGSSTTLAPTAFSGKAAIMSADWMPVPRAGFTATVSGTGAACTLGWTNTFYQLPTSGSTGHSYARLHGLSGVDYLTNLWPDDANVQLNYAKRIWISGRSLIVFPAITNMIARVSFGKADTTGVGDLNARGIGWKYTTGASQFVQLMVHNGTTLTTVNSSFTPSNVAFDWDVVSEGNGNVTLYINGSSVATTSAGPSTRATSNQTNYQEEAVVNGTIPNAFCRFYCARGAIYVQR
jgi:hypothetical protein